MNRIPTQDEIDGMEILYSTLTTDEGVSRMVYTENRTVVFTSEPWTSETPKAEYAAIIGRFMTMIAHHEIAERLNGWSPAHTGYSVRCWRESGVSWLLEKADRIEAWAANVFTDDGYQTFRTAQK